MYNSRIGFPRRMNSVNLSRHGATQYIRPINTIDVPPYTITNTQIDEAVRVISSNHGSAVIDNSYRSRHATEYLNIGSVPSILSSTLSQSRRNRHPNRSQNNVELVTIEYDPSDQSYTTTNIPYSRNNIVGIHEISNTTYQYGNNRQCLDISIISNNRCLDTWNWQQSLHFFVTTAEDSYSGNTQGAIKCKTYIDNDNSGRYIKFINEGVTDLLLMQCNINNQNPVNVPDLQPDDDVPMETVFPLTISSMYSKVIHPGESEYANIDFNMLARNFEVDEYSYGSLNLSSQVSTISIEKDLVNYVISQYEPDSLGFNPNTDPSTLLPDITTNYKIQYAYARIDQFPNSF